MSTYDGDSTDLTTNKTIYLYTGGSQTAPGHIDYAGDMDYCNLYIGNIVGNSGLYDATSTGSTTAYIYDATAGAIVLSSSGGYQSDLRINPSHTNYVCVTGYTSGQNYSVTVEPSHSHDGNATDLTTNKTIYATTSGAQTATGHTDYYDYYYDEDHGNLVVDSTGYFTVSSTGNPTATVYDASNGNWVSNGGGNSTSDLYLQANNKYSIYVYGYTNGENYSVTVAPDTSSNFTDGDSADLTTNTTIYTNISDYQTAYGHTDSYGDWDYGNLSIPASGYYDVTSSGVNISSYIYDATACSWVSSGSGSYSGELCLNADHANYVFVCGYSTGDFYSVTVKPHI